jgi:ATP-dependent RNA helicase DDX19/DBP5
MKFAQKFSPKANEIKLKHEELTVAGIQQMFLDCPSEDSKYDILVQLYGLLTIGSSIIFVKVCTSDILSTSPRSCFPSVIQR